MTGLVQVSKSSMASRRFLMTASIAGSGLEKATQQFWGRFGVLIVLITPFTPVSSLGFWLHRTDVIEDPLWASSKGLDFTSLCDATLAKRIWVYNKLDDRACEKALTRLFVTASHSLMEPSWRVWHEIHAERTISTLHYQCKLRNCRLKHLPESSRHLCTAGHWFLHGKMPLRTNKWSQWS